MEKLKAYFERSLTLPESQWQYFSSKLTRREFSAMTILLKTGETEKYISFVEKGILRHFVSDEDSDFTFSFSFHNEFTCAFESFLEQTPTVYQVQALQQTVLWSISYTDMQEVFQQSLVGNSYGCTIIQKMLLIKSRREISLLRDSAEVRYLKLLREWPDIIQYIKLKYIASYLGITPQALSRIRRNLKHGRRHYTLQNP